MTANIELYVRVRLPNPSAYPACPSGDTEYESDYRKALEAAIPPGFEVIAPRSNRSWPHVGDGWNLVPVRCTSAGQSLLELSQSLRVAREELAGLKMRLAEFLRTVLDKEKTS